MKGNKWNVNMWGTLQNSVCDGHRQPPPGALFAVRTISEMGGRSRWWFFRWLNSHEARWVEGEGAIRTYNGGTRNRRRSWERNRHAALPKCIYIFCLYFFLSAFVALFVSFNTHQNSFSDGGADVWVSVFLVLVRIVEPLH